MIIRTVGGYDFYEVSSAMQKASGELIPVLPAFLPWSYGRVGIGIMFGRDYSPSALRIASVS